MYDTNFGKAGFIALSSFLGAFSGLVLSVVVAFSLLEISVTLAFSLIFGVGFCLLGVALIWRICQSVAGRTQKIIFIIFALLVVASGISCFFLDVNWFKKMTSPEKIPLYSLLGISFSFSLTFSFSELISLGPCDRCCNTNHKTNPVFGTSNQVFALFATTLTMGFVFGLLFGLTDVEDDGQDHEKLQVNIVYSIPIGIVCGALFGAFNQWYRVRQQYQDITAPLADDDNKF